MSSNEALKIIFEQAYIADEFQKLIDAEQTLPNDYELIPGTTDS